MCNKKNILKIKSCLLDSFKYYYYGKLHLENKSLLFKDKERIKLQI